ncbi:amino acid adenylation domain-containing protein [Pseudonocardia sp. RS11V-5]|uniref:Pls/PosA family non-ribosomal peptide synthetase n=1 Tax=Pseudonocardia terrae TaxID=2905831 RepID=UPI001E483650|nr:Pls/PosA family non-ribosomal peptide synthetase [Pseudonocardia terrae]MCE3550917.1 amino acid adenylation domain-containing protein [Pseudonocardia terrae]
MGDRETWVSVDDGALADPTPSNPALSNPALSNPALSNPAPSNPALSNPVLSNPAPSDLVLEGPGSGRGVRWHPGERLEQLFERRCALEDASGRSDHLAVDAVAETLTYAQLNARANQVARHLVARGVGTGGRVALLVDDAVCAYVGMLGVLKAGAAYVPLDPGFPPERVVYILADAQVGAVLSTQHLSDRLGHVDVPVVCMDTESSQIAIRADGPLADHDRGEPVDRTAYIIYTSGSTGRPKGVAVEHASICNFVRVAAEVYGFRSDDRVYQGLTIAFDFSVEEIWVPWMVGATLVPKPAGSTLVGVELQEFLTERRVSALCCVPTLLATIDDDLPGLRFLLVSGEACPHDLIVRWHREDRRFLNVYGPTEATVTATWTVVHPDRPVTIGRPLPTYAVVILDPDDPGRALPHGAVGEIGIAGVGLAAGYVGRDDLNASVFVPDFLGIRDNPSGRIYRTGDLGRVDADGELEYLGRIDLQVKIRGYRVELTEIESVMLEVPGVAQAVVATFEPVPGSVALVGYYSLRHDTDSVDPADIHRVLRDRLPSYMVPTYLEHLPVIPMTTSDKADRKRLPAPTTPAMANTREYVAPRTETEQVLARLLAQTLGLERVSVDSHLFEELGADSLQLARFSARVRNGTDLSPPAMKELYLNPTVEKLAAVVEAGDGTRNVSTDEVLRVSTVRYVVCGAVQVLLYLAFACLISVVFTTGLAWMDAADGFLSMLMRSVGFSVAAFVVMSVLPIALKRLLVGRWTAREFPLWGATYLRFWVVRILVRANPLTLFVGSPLFNVYLRALGARVGRNVVILSRNVPVCTDLVTIGDDTVVRKDSSFNGYRAYAGRIRTGRVTLGSHVLVGERTVLDIDVAMGDGAQLGHASSLHTGQVVPAGQSWHGSPAQPGGADHRTVAPARCGRFRRFSYSLWQLVFVAVLAAPLGLTVAVQLLRGLPLLQDVQAPGLVVGPRWNFASQALVYVSVTAVGALVFGLVVVFTIPRLVALGLRPGAVYPLYGIRYWAQRTVQRLTNFAFFTALFGDSSAIVHYLRLLGYDLGSPVVQTGSNFGLEVRHETPFLSRVGSGTLVSDGLSMLNAEYSSTSFRVRPTVIGAENFLGNNIAFPAGARTGDNCLLATKVMVPLAGRVREGVGLLGSPPFEIPRSVHRDRTFDHHLKSGEERRRRVRAKNLHNTVTAVLYLLVTFVDLYIVAVFGLLAVDVYSSLGFLAMAPTTVGALVLMLAFRVLVERAATGFRALEPRFCSIYDRRFWRHERIWKLSSGKLLALFNGTPMKNLVWWTLGVRIGHKVFDDGCGIPEKTLVTIGDYATLNAATTIQAHSLEDGAFKSDRIVIERDCTLGTAAWVHYGVRMREGAVLDADAFLMKGTDVPAWARYRGNPATELREPLPVHSVSPGATPMTRSLARAAVAVAVFAAIAALPPPQVGPVPMPVGAAATRAVPPPAPPIYGPAQPPTTPGSGVVSLHRPAQPGNRSDGPSPSEAPPPSGVAPAPPDTGTAPGSADTTP